MTRFLLISLIVLGAIASSTVFSQKNNRLTLQTGMFHSFFDESPILNTNYKNKASRPFKGLFYNSLGFQYSRVLNPKSTISIEYMYYYEGYWNVQPNLLKNVVFSRSYNTINVTYERILPFSKFNITYGGGVNYRNGSESIVVNYYYFGSLGFYESLLETRILNDIGLNLRTGIEYKPKPWITFSTKFDLLGFIYLNDKKAVQKLQQNYNYKDYPYRFDLSWRFGIGFNFGK